MGFYRRVHTIGDFMQLDYSPKVCDVPVSTEHTSDERHGVLCTHNEHANYADDRLLREGNRVTVAVVSDNKTSWHIGEIRCLHCPLSVDVHETVPDFSVYDETNVILAEATLAPDGEGELVLDDPHIISARVSIPGM